MKCYISMKPMCLAITRFELVARDEALFIGSGVARDRGIHARIDG